MCVGGPLSVLTLLAAWVCAVPFALADSRWRSALSNAALGKQGRKEGKLRALPSLLNWCKAWEESYEGLLGLENHSWDPDWGPGHWKVSKLVLPQRRMEKTGAAAGIWGGRSELAAAAICLQLELRRPAGPEPDSPCQRAPP